MELYEYSNADSSSDSGSVKILVRASNLITARRMAEARLKEAGREDLVKGLKLLNSVPAPESGVIYDDIEGP